MTFRAKPCVVTQRERWMPIAAILSLPTQTDVTRSRAGERSARDSEVGERADQRLLEIRDVSLDVRRSGDRFEDRVSDELSRPVVGHFAAAVGFPHGDAELAASLRGEEDVGASGVAPEREDRLVLEQKERLFAARRTLAAASPWRRERIVVRDRPSQRTRTGAGGAEPRRLPSAKSIGSVTEEQCVLSASRRSRPG